MCPPPSHTHSNITTWRVHNALLIIRLTLKYILENQSEAEAILQLDGSATIPQIVSLEEMTQTKTVSSKVKEDGGGSSVPNGSQDSTSPGSSLTRVSGSTLDSLAGKSAGNSSEGDGGRSVEVMRRGGGVRGASINPAEVAAMDVLLSRQLLEGLVCLLAEVPLM